jgi:CubicO group peptidase (beta-lactamase class C family)
MDLQRAIASVGDAVLRAGFGPGAPGVGVMATTATDASMHVAGDAIVEHSVALSPHTLLYAASLAKLVTSYCVHQLAVDGLLDIDEPVAEWFPALADGTRITVRQLLLHRSGLPEYHALRLVAGHVVDDRLEAADVRRLVDGMGTWFEPGSRVSYNNTNFAMLAEVVAQVTGQPFPRAARSLVFEPHGLAGATFRGSPDEAVPGGASGYTPAREGFRTALMGAASVGDGGLWWSVSHLVGFGRLLLSGGPVVDAMRQRVALPDGTVPDLATGCSVAPDGSWFGAAAEFTGYAGQLRVYEAVAIGAMSNRQDAPVGALLDELATALGSPAAAPRPPEPFAPGPAPQGVLVGLGGAPWLFRAAADGLVAVSVGGVGFEMEPHGAAWRVKGRPAMAVGWVGDDLAVRDGTREVARLSPTSGGAAPDPVLREIAGWWWCREARAVLHLEPGDGGLVLRRGQLAPEVVVPAGERAGRWVLAAPWGLLEFDGDLQSGAVVVHRAEGLPIERLAAYREDVVR